MESWTPGWPLTRTRRVTFWAVSSTAAMSFSRTGTPLMSAITVSRSCSRLPYSPGVRMITSCWPRSTVPEGRVMFPALMEFSTWSSGTPSDLTRSAFKLIRISRSRPPITSRAATPGTRSMRYLICSSMIRRTWIGSRLLEAPMTRIGMLDGSNFLSVGRSISSGSRLITRSRRSRTSLAALSRFVPQANETRTRLLPSADSDEISSTPGTALMASSIGRVTSSSTSSGLAFS
ncbi:MAG: hypothetical protein BWY73_00510 [candidate division TA06 bacterium ADurb.Bin417]|uniref:Uncharacterized protein n=1 Tax=candidate division TA06 bacterium ADurb.Bin417 TaxID=1852828 RepID=A0A1V5MII4_UNCT6|nr:MAG: hypothetical protein BWY73_00510 [candidate division TA06 bacterium ADurb.Bin417]